MEIGKKSIWSLTYLMEIGEKITMPQESTADELRGYT